MSKICAHIALLFAVAGWQQTASEPNGTAISADLFADRLTTSLSVLHLSIAQR